MAKYVITCQLAGLYGDAEPGEYSLSWQTIAEKRLTSKVIDFPNEIKDGQEIRLQQDGQEISEVVANVYHDLTAGYSVLDLGKKEAKNSDSDDKARQDFDELVEKYSFIEKF